MIVDEEGMIKYASPSVRNVLGHDTEALVGRRATDLVHPDDLARVRQETEPELTDSPGAVVRRELRALSAGEKWRWMQMVTTNMIHAPSVQGYVVNFHDITERRRSQQELRKRQEEFQTLAENAPDIILRFDSDLRHIYASPALECVTGISAHEFLGHTLTQMRLPSSLAGPWETAVESVLETGESDVIEFSHQGKDGRLYFHARLVPEFGVEGGIESVLSIARDVTDRVRAEQEIKRSEEHFRSLIEGVSDLIALIDLEGRISYVSPSVERILGYVPRSIIGDSVFSFLHEDDIQQATEILAAYQHGEDPSEFVELRLRREDGTWAYMSAIGRRYDGQGAPSVIVNARDISEQHELYEELRRERDLFSALTETSPIGITMVDKDGWIVFANPRAEEILGLSAEGITERTYDDPEWAITDFEGNPFPDEELPFTRVMKSGQPVYAVRHAIDWPDGSRKLVSISGAPVKDRHGAVRSAVFAIEDVTEAEAAAQALRRSEERYRLLFERNQAAVFRAALEGELMEYNRAFARLFGLPGDRAKGLKLSLRELYDRPEGRDDFVDRMLGDGHVSQYGVKMRRADGEASRVLKSAVLLEGNADNHVYLGTLLDVSAQRKAQERIAASERRFRALVQNATDLITLVDRQGVIRYQSPSIRSVLGYDPEEVLGRTASELIHPADLEGFNETMAELEGEPGATASGELRVVHRDGSFRYLEMHGTNSLQDPAIKAIVVNARDVTDRRRNTPVREAVLRVAGALRSADSREEMPPIILGELQKLLRADSVAMVTYDERRDHMVIERALGPWARFENRRLPRGQGLSWRVHERAGPVVIPNLGAEAAFEGSKYRSEDYVGLGVPLILGDQVAGVIWLAREHRFETDEINVVVAVADMAANGLNRASLHEETVTRADQLAQIATLGQTLGQMLDESFIHKRLVGASAEILPDVSAVLLSRYSASEEQFTLAYGVDSGTVIDVSQAPPLKLKPVGRGQQSDVIRSKKPLIVDDFEEIYARNPEARMGDPPYPRSGFYVPLVSRGEVVGVLQLQSLTPSRFTEHDAEIMTLVANAAAVALVNAQLFDETQASTVQLSVAYDTTLEGWAKALELRAQETEGHTRRVAELTVQLALEMEVPVEEMIHIRRGALLHDIGKMGIPDNILLKPGPPTEDEWEVMRRHPVYARDLLEEVEYLRPALDIPYYHHERWDGSGYPEGLSGEGIPLAARVFAVIDVYDALCSVRPYREAWPEPKARQFLAEKADELFDPQVVGAFLGMLEE